MELPSPLAWVQCHHPSECLKYGRHLYCTDSSNIMRKAEDYATKQLMAIIKWESKNDSGISVWNAKVCELKGIQTVLF